MSRAFRRPDIICMCRLPIDQCACLRTEPTCDELERKDPPRIAEPRDVEEATDVSNQTQIQYPDVTCKGDGIVGEESVTHGCFSASRIAEFRDLR